MKKNLFIVIVLFFAIQIGELNAQVFSEDIQRMHLFYKTQKSYKTDVRVEIYSDKSKSPIMVKEALVRKNNSRFFYKMEETELLLTEKELIMVNHSNHVVLYRQIEKKEYEAIQKDYYSQQLDSVLSKYDSVKYEGVKNNKKYYTVYSSKKLIKSAQLALDVNNNQLMEITYHYDSRLSSNVSKVYIVFANIDTNPVFPADFFSEAKFVIKEGKTIRLSQKYSKYQLNIVNHED